MLAHGSFKYYVFYDLTEKYFMYYTEPKTNQHGYSYFCERFDVHIIHKGYCFHYSLKKWEKVEDSE